MRHNIQEEAHSMGGRESSSPVVEQEEAGDGSEHQDDGHAQFELLIFIFVCKSRMKIQFSYTTNKRLPESKQLKVHILCLVAEKRHVYIT